MEGLPCLDKVETAAFYRKALSRKMAKHFHRPQRRFEALSSATSIFKEYWLRVNVMVTGVAMIAMVMMSTATMMTREATKRALAYFAAQ